MIGRGLDRLFVRFRDKNDGAALAAVFDATSRRLLEVACHLVRNASDAEDLVQATFLTAIRKAATYEDGAPVQGWLYGILWREAAKMRRAASRTVEASRLALRVESSPEGIVQRSEIPLAIQEALARLPRRYREVIEPVIRAEESPEAIARRLGRSPGTVRSQIHRGMERLRRHLPPSLAAFPSIALEIRGLSAVRASVLRAAGFQPATVAAISTLGFELVLGGSIMSLKTLSLAGAAAAALALGWFTWHGRNPFPTTDAPPQTAAQDHRHDVTTDAVSLEAAESKGQRTADRTTEGPTGEASDAPPSERSIDYWIARYDEAPDDWQHGLRITQEIAKLPPDEALRIMRGVWPHLSTDVKVVALKPFTERGAHEHLLKILDLAARDAAAPVQKRAFSCLSALAFRDFAEDFDGYLQWAERFRDLPISEVASANARSLVSELLALSPQDLNGRVESLGRLQVGWYRDWSKELDVSGALVDAGGLRVLETLLKGDDSRATNLAFQWATWMRADEGWLRTWALPRLEQSIPGTSDLDGADDEARAGEIEKFRSSTSSAIYALARSDCGWARDPLLDYLARSTAQDFPGSSSAAHALAAIGDPAAIPKLIEILVHNPNEHLKYDIGHGALSGLTGVGWSESHDGAWWLDWWERNKMRFPPEVRDVAIRR